MSVDWLSLGVLALVAAAFAAIFILRRRRVGFTVVTLGALGVGLAIGVVFSGHVGFVAPIGRIYVAVLGAIVAPLIIVSILSSVTSLRSVAQLKGIGLRSVAWLLGSTLLAIVLALGLGLVFGVGRNSALAIDGLDPSGLENQLVSFSTVLVDFFPHNVVLDIAENKIIPIILFTLLIAVSYVLVANKNPAKLAPFKALVDAVREIVYKAVAFIIELTPYAVLALVAVSAGNGASQGVVWSLIALLLVSFVAFAIDSFLLGGVLVTVFAQVNPVAFFRKLLPAQVVGFSTQSSAGTLPVTTDILTAKVGVAPAVANFTAPLGTTIGMPGCAGIWPMLVAIYGIHGLGIDYSAADYAVLALLCLFVSLGTAGVPGTATITTASVLTAVGLPLEILLLVVPISAIADTGRTATNVTGAAIAATIVAREEGALDDEVFAGTKQFAPTDDDGPPPGNPASPSLVPAQVAADGAPDPFDDGFPLGGSCPI
ncbi:MAG: dicarboxylate/amino acid:cation symporter [Bifidobacteriaceae bacterium]|jgi:Na+/H+-dicarboxylate symporter|nr:dicarboxylate/amino acid:cation symporter [Bifidobacteriaceae bacterium]